MKHRIKLLPILILLLLQPRTLHPIYDDLRVNNIMWSSDSTSIVFLPEYGGVAVQVPQDAAWQQFHLRTKQITKSSIWPFQPTLTDQEKATFVLGSEGRDVSFAFTSPNGKYLVYAGQILTSRTWPVMLADRQSGQVVDTLTRVYVPNIGTDYFRVYWSTDSTAFVVYALTGGYSPIAFFVFNFNQQLKNLETKELLCFTVARTDYFLSDLYGVSDNGRNVLLRVHNPTAPSWKDFKLVRWDALNPSQLQFLQINADDVIGASLVSGNDQKVLLVNSTGLIEYDVISNQSVIKRTDISAAWASRAVFSPNSEYVTVAKDSAELTYTTLFVERTNK